MRDRFYAICTLLYILLLTFVWQPLVRLLLVAHPKVEIFCKFVNDALWVLPALLLPFLIARLIVPYLHEKGPRVFIYIVATMMTLFALLNLKIYFKVLIFIIFIYLLFIVLDKKCSVRRILFIFLLGMIVSHYGFQLLPKKVNSVDTLKVASFNVNSRQRQKPELMAVKVALENDYDVLFLQELPPKSPEYLAKTLVKAYPYQLLCDTCSPYYSVMIVSKIPFSSGMNYNLQYEDDASFEINHAVLDYHGTAVNLLNCHISNPVGSLQINGSKIGTRDHNIVKRYQRHEKEGELILSFLRQIEGPIILGVDLNDTPNSRLYHFISKEVQDTFAQAGWGLGTTYGYWIFRELSPKWMQNLYFYPVRIDYLFCSPDFKVTDAQVLKIKSSEHLPISAELSLQ